MTELQPVDRLEIQVLVDNVTDTLSSTPPFVTRELALLLRQGMRITSGGAMCCANHGLSLVITAHGPDGPRTLLFDGGPVDYAVERNGMRLGINFGAIGAAMLSHGHWDHAGGLPRAVSMIVQANGGRAVPLFLHPGMFRPRGQRQPDGGVLPGEAIPTPEQWALLGAEPVVTDAAQTCLDGTFFVSGEIPRVTGYEQGLVGQVCRPSDGADWVPDPLLMDERFLAVHVRGKGLVVFSACSHAGIVNVLHHARASIPGREAARGDGRLPSVRPDRGDHPGDGARSRQLRARPDHSGALHRLARAERAGAGLWRGGGAAVRGGEAVHAMRADKGRPITHSMEETRRTVHKLCKCDHSS